MAIRVTTQNIDFALSDARWDGIVADLKKRSDVILFQETKKTNLHQYRDSEWDVFQIRATEATAGTGIMWRRSLGKKGQSGLDDFVEKRKGIEMGTRYIAWVDIATELGVIRFASAHFPPGRFKVLWPEANKSIDRFIRKARGQRKIFVIGSDFNFKFNGDMHGIAARLKAVVTGIRIDGFVIGRRLKVSEVVNLGDNRSNHDPLQVTLTKRRGLTRRK